MCRALGRPPNCSVLHPISDPMAKKKPPQSPDASNLPPDSPEGIGIRRLRSFNEALNYQVEQLRSREALASRFSEEIPVDEISLPFASDDVPSMAQLEESLARAGRELKDKEQATADLKKEYARNYEEYRKHEILRLIRIRVGDEAQALLDTSEDFRKLFLHTEECYSFVLAVDIRKSTDLMLKARNPKQFAVFITKLCTDLQRSVLDNYGVFDKFTGDGILAFFPDFYTGDDAGHFALAAAEACHQAFTKHYRDHRNCFSAVYKNAGLGIGLDFGLTSLIREWWAGFTVVGTPVVYACRLSAAEAGQTLLNQPAYEKLQSHRNHFCDCFEAGLEIKHEGALVAYQAKLKSDFLRPNKPDWSLLMQRYRSRVVSST